MIEGVGSSQQNIKLPLDGHVAHCEGRSLSPAGKRQPLWDMAYEAEAVHSSYPLEQAHPTGHTPAAFISSAVLGEPDIDVTAAADSIALHALRLLRNPAYAQLTY